MGQIILRVLLIQLAFAPLATAAGPSATRTSMIDIAECFKLYYRQQTASGQYQQPLSFLQTAATAHADA